MSEGYPDPLRRALITIPVILAAIMVTIDSTIANVAIPHMQSSLSASQDQIVWVLTSYLIGGAIATPLSGWLAGRYGRRRIMAISVAGFTLASVLCGAANGLMMMVASRALQGAFGAALIPLSQAILLDINPPEKIARAMALFSLGALMGPMIGPTLGGWLTDSLSWRWVFFVNIPFGMLSLVGILAFTPETRDAVRRRFDLFGFLTVSAALASSQLMLDRGEVLDWFEDPEIWLYAVILGVSVYLAAVHMFTARDTFLKPEMFRNRNFAVGNLMSILLGIVLLATVPLVAVMTQSLLGYTPLQAGLIGLPRAIGTALSMLALAPLIGKIDTRIVLFTGMSIAAIGALLYSHFSLEVDDHTLIVAGVVQGIGAGLVFTPLSVLTFSTLAPHLRNEGAAMFSLTRNIGNAVGISLLQRQLTHVSVSSQSYMVENVRPDNPVLQYAMPDFDFTAPSTVAQFARLISRQASMAGNVEVYQFLFIVTLLMLPLILLLRTGGRATKGESLPVME